MVILINGYGNHSNRLFQALNLEAFCLEYGIRFYNPSFHDMAPLYHIKRYFFDVCVCAIIRILKRFKICTIHILEKNKNDMEANYTVLKGQKIIFVEGWDFTCHNLIKKHHAVLKNKYSFKTDIIAKYINTVPNNYNDVMMKMKNYQTVIGVHIRRGDYSGHEGGKYFYSDEVYQSIIGVTEKLFIQAPLFILFSNECITLPSPQNTIISQSPWYIEQHIMSRCNYLLGPPSTFTLWASFIGEVLLYFIYTKNDAPKNLSEFTLGYR